MTITRRGFLRGLFGGVLGLIGLPALLRAPLLYLRRAEATTAKVGVGVHDWTNRRWAFIVDANKCIGCGLCILACKQENNVPTEPEYNRTWVERYVYTNDGQVFVDSPEAGIEGFTKAPANVKYAGLDIHKAYFVPKLCNQCDNPPCVQVCPVGATYKNEDGVVLIDAEHCIGCRYCIQACPYGARYLVPERSEVSPLGYTKVADKCTWCYQRITKGLRPACVEVCPVGARIFGDLRDPESPVWAILREHPPLAVLKPALGTQPQVYYIGIDSEVR